MSIWGNECEVKEPMNRLLISYSILTLDMGYIYNTNSISAGVSTQDILLSIRLI